VLFIISLSAISYDIHIPNTQEFKKKQEERTQILEDALKRAEECGDQICSKWRFLASGNSYTMIYYPSSNQDWEFEGMLFDKGSIGRFFGYDNGDITVYYNKVGNNEYVGESIVRNFFRVFGWIPTTMYLKDGNRITTISKSPAGMNVVGTVQSGIRLDKKKFNTKVFNE